MEGQCGSLLLRIVCKAFIRWSSYVLNKLEVICMKKSSGNLTFKSAFTTIGLGVTVLLLAGCYGPPTNSREFEATMEPSASVEESAHRHEDSEDTERAENGAKSEKAKPAGQSVNK